MGLWRRGRARRPARAQSEAQAALAVASQHAEAGWRAQVETHVPQWAPPAWSDPQWAPPPPPPAVAAPAVAEAAGAESLLAPDVAAPPAAAPAAAHASVPEAAAAPAPERRAVAAAPGARAATAPAGFDVPAELIRVLEVVTSMCDHVIEYIEADRAERRLMLETLTTLSRTLREQHAEQPPMAVPAERVVGGSMPATEAKVIDLREPETAVEVRCRFGDNWVDGFEICEVINDPAGVRYRLRRRVDGVVLPELFDASNIRHVETFEQLTATPPQQRYWSPL
jgi:hypothetical protein